MKTLDKVRPGGIVAFITSKGTLDKQDSTVREYLAQRADILGAVRLPNNAFSRNAGTDVTTDMLFLQKAGAATGAGAGLGASGADRRRHPYQPLF